MKKKAVITIIVLAILAIATIFIIKPFVGAETPLNKEKYVQSTTPTLFFHGYGSSANAEKHMTGAARKAGVTKTIITANVDRNGRVTLDGDIPKGAINPIVEVNYEDNRNPDAAGDYANAVVRELYKQYGFTKMNMVGHSMGNLSILHYVLNHSQDENLPQLQKQVNIANHVNGLEGRDLPEGLTVDKETGQPNKMSQTYEKLIGLREVFPQHQVDVLNIYGDYKNGSDGSVLNTSSLSLKHLVIDNAKSYQEKKITGKLAQHSQLHENPQVDEILINFLWGK